MRNNKLPYLAIGGLLPALVTGLLAMPLSCIGRTNRCIHGNGIAVLTGVVFILGLVAGGTVVLLYKRLNQSFVAIITAGLLSALLMAIVASLMFYGSGDYRNLTTNAPIVFWFAVIVFLLTTVFSTLPVWLCLKGDQTRSGS